MTRMHWMMMISSPKINRGYAAAATKPCICFVHVMGLRLSSQASSSQVDIMTLNKNTTQVCRSQV